MVQIHGTLLLMSGKNPTWKQLSLLSPQEPGDGPAAETKEAPRQPSACPARRKSKAAEETPLFAALMFRACLAVCETCNRTKVVPGSSEEEIRGKLIEMGWAIKVTEDGEAWLPSEMSWLFWCPTCRPRRARPKDVDEFLGGDEQEV